MTDIESFINEIMSFLTEQDVEELSEKAGVRFPIQPDCDWESLCYICAWVGFSKELPENLLNRMMIGTPNNWTKLYLIYLRKNSVCSLFELAG